MSLKVGKQYTTRQGLLVTIIKRLGTGQFLANTGVVYNPNGKNNICFNDDLIIKEILYITLDQTYKPKVWVNKPDAEDQGIGVIEITIINDHVVKCSLLISESNA